MLVPSDEPIKAPGNLDLPRLFQAEALSLLEAVERGKLLHSTKNIRDSGGPLEARLRSLLADRMPGGIQVSHGYLYDVDSNCTPQIDAMLLSRLDNHSMMTTADGAAYAPFASALAVIEIKSSVRDVAKQLEQTREIVSRIRKMATDLRERRANGGAVLPSTVSVLFYATSADAAIQDFKDWAAANRGAMPTYVVFLDRACILTARGLLSTLQEDGDRLPIEFNDYQQPATPSLCSPKTVDALSRGRVLLWLYFTLLNVANQFGGNLRPAGDFISDAVTRYSLYPVADLSSITDWPPSLAP